MNDPWKIEARRLIYAEPLSCRVILLVLSIMICSALDAIFTLIHIAEGGSDLNPYVTQLLTFQPVTFVCLKMALTGAGTLVLAALHQATLAYVALHALTLVYFVVMWIHVMIWFY